MTAAAAPPEVARLPAAELDIGSARRSALLRTGVVALATTAALPYSLAALVADFRYAGALGELVLVPFCALALALAAAWRHPWVAALRPGRADWALAAGSAGLAAGLLTVGPVLAGNLYYAVRPDLLAVPLVAVAAVCLLFGVRALVAFVLPLLLLCLTWPLPLRAVLEPATAVLTELTSGALRLVLQVLPLATPVPGTGDLRLLVPAAGGPFEVVVASACSGMTGVGGTLLVALAAQYVLHGSARSRALWLTVAVVMAWVLNLLRIALLLGVGRVLGERVALDVVHPVAGLLLLNLSFAALLLLAPRCGLALGLASPVPADTPLTSPAPVPDRMRRSSLVRRASALAAVAVVLGVLDTVVPGTAGAYAAGDPAARASTAPAVRGYVLGARQEQAWARVYYGQDSSWTRYRLHPATGGNAPTLWVDSVTTGEWAALRAHPLLDCYRFHGFDVQRTSRRILARGVLADEVVYRRPDGATWHVLSWQWPVRSTGDALRHERVVLLASSVRTDLVPGSTRRGEAAPLGAGLRALLASRWPGADPAPDPNPSLTAALRTAADDLVVARLPAAPTPERSLR